MNDRFPPGAENKSHAETRRRGEKNGRRECFILKNRTEIAVSWTNLVEMISRILKNLFRRPPIRMGRVDNSRIRTTTIRNSGFVSFISATGSLRARNTDHHDARLRRRRFFKGLVLAILSAGGAWIVIESARALTLF